LSELLVADQLAPLRQGLQLLFNRLLTARFWLCSAAQFRQDLFFLSVTPLLTLPVEPTAELGTPLTSNAAPGRRPRLRGVREVQDARRVRAMGVNELLFPFRAVAHRASALGSLQTTTRRLASGRPRNLITF